MKRFLKVIIATVFLLAFLFFIGPHPSTPIYSKILPTVPADADGLEKYIDSSECQHKLKKDNQARTFWYNDSTKQKTDYAIVYLHGFSSSQGEGAPTHRTIAKEFGCNLYLSRLAEHGIDTSEQLLNLTADNYWESAKEALVIGKQLGKKVILMGTSSGGALAIQLAAAFPDDVASIVLYSPNIAIYDKNAWLLNQPWGLQIARLVVGGKYLKGSVNDSINNQYWNHLYRIEGAVALQEIVATSMTDKTFAAVHQPALALYYYNDELHQDTVVKVSAIKSMLISLATPDSLKRGVAMPNAGNHVLCSSIRSKDVAGTIRETEKFLVEVMHLKKL